jgi:hypothetical protein
MSLNSTAHRRHDPAVRRHRLSARPSGVHHLVEALETDHDPLVQIDLALVVREDRLVAVLEPQLLSDGRVVGLLDA